VGPGPLPPRVGPIPTRVDIVPKVPAIRREVRRVPQEEEDGAWAVRVGEYTMWRGLLAPPWAGSGGLTWASYMWDPPRGALKSLSLSLSLFLSLFLSISSNLTLGQTKSHASENTARTIQ
jgi:hypothetical protein